MRDLTIDIAHALILIIPFHGIFLSLFCINKSRYNLTPNLYLGLLLFILSFQILFQIIYRGYGFIALQVSHYFFFCELLISPFLFLYNSIMIQPDMMARIYLHLVIITFIFLLFFLIGSVSGAVFIIMAVIYIMLNGLYLAGSVRLLIDLAGRTDFKWKHLPASSYSGIIIFNLLAAVTVILSAFFNMICPVNTIYIAQIPKAMVIYYIYFKILKEVDFVN